jgi:DNA-binding NarL/FixJ family response regulator
MGRRRILILDDDALTVERIQKILEPHFEVVATAGDGDALFGIAPSLRPDVILVDIRMAAAAGFHTGQQLKSRLPSTKFILLATKEDSDIASDAMRHWASGYVFKKSGASELIKAIREVLKGNWYVTPKLAQQLLDHFVRDPRPEHTAKLTPRQREVLQLLATGKNMKEAADILHITRRTIAFHKYRIMDEFGLRTNSDLMVFAIRAHVISA